MDKKIITRKEAIEQGLKRYFTGLECKHGHVSERYIWNSGCIACDKFIRNKIEKTYYAKNGKRVREKKKPYQDEYRKNNGEKISRQKSEHYQKNKERISAEHSEYYQSNKERFIEYAENRRARILGNGGQHTHKQALEILEKQKYKCINCKCDLRKVEKHKDHIIPLALGGTGNIENIQWLCQSCNCSKRHRDPIEWAQKQGRLL